MFKSTIFNRIMNKRYTSESICYLIVLAILFVLSFVYCYFGYEFKGYLIGGMFLFFLVMTIVKTKFKFPFFNDLLIILLNLLIFVCDDGLANASMGCIYYFPIFLLTTILFNIKKITTRVFAYSILSLFLFSCTNIFIDLPFHKQSSIFLRALDFVMVLIAIKFYILIISRRYYEIKQKQKIENQDSNQIYNYSNEVIFNIDLDFNLIGFNQKFEKFFIKYFDVVPLKNLSIQPLFTNIKIFDKITDEILRLKSGESQLYIGDVEVQVFEFFVRYKMLPVFDYDDTLIGVRFFANDITNEKKLQAKVDYQTNLYESILMNIPLELCLLNKDGKSIFVNSYAQKDKLLIFLGNTHLDLYEKELTKVDKKLLQARHDVTLNCIKTKVGEIIEEEIVNQTTGLTHYYIRHFKPILDSADEVSCVVEFSIDVSELRRYKVKIDAQKMQFEKILLDIPLELTIIDTTGKFVFLNKKAQKTEEGRQKYIGKTHLDFIENYELPAALFITRNKAYLDCINQEKEIIIQEEITSVTTGLVHYHIRHFKPIFNNDNKIICAIEFGIETTNMINAQQQMRAQKELYEFILEALPIDVMLIDASLGTMYANKLARNSPDLITTYNEKNLAIAGQNIEYSFVNFEQRQKVYLEVLKSKKHIYNKEEKWVADASEQFFLRSYIPVTRNNEIEFILMTGLNITTEKQAQIKLENTLNLLENSLAEKQKFLSVISHEIRTPLNAISLLTDALASEDISDSILDSIKLMRFSSDILVGLVNDFLDLTKIEEGKLQLINSTVDIKIFLHSLIRTYTPKANEVGTNLVFVFDDSISEPVAFDKVRLAQIITNLVFNAIKFTDKGVVELIVSCKTETSSEYTILFQIKDTGIGISENNIKTIFDRFTKSQDARTQSYQGAGLGLSISKNLVELFGGQLNVNSTVGVGSVFYFEINVAKSINNEKENIINYKNILMNSKQSKSILIAEDNQVNTRILQKIFTSLPFDFVYVTNGQEAIDVTLSKKFDLILMDIQMPILDGKQAARAIRSNYSNSNFNSKIIAFTADSLSIEMLKAEFSQFDGVIYKPIILEKLYEFLHHNL